MNEVKMTEERLRTRCSICGKAGTYQLNEKELNDLMEYEVRGRSMGYLQEIFPNIPPWIRSGAIDKFSGGFCICPSCCEV